MSGQHRKCCAHCGQSFLTNRPERSRFCSKKCYLDHGRATVTCKTCGTEFVVLAHTIHTTRARQFCSHQCYSVVTGEMRTKPHKHERRHWYAMRQRCSNPNYKDFKHYGGRGIYVCDRWKDSFENFISDMGPRPSPKHSVERLNNDGPYSPDNCAWATQKEQTRNQRRTHWIEFDGKRQSMKDWSEQLGISYTKLRRRLNTLGWSVDKALTTP